MDIKYNILFPYLEDRSKYNYLKIDTDSVYCTTTCNQSRIITNIIFEILKDQNMQKTDTTITDMTAGVGGNVISFGINFKKVNAIEINEKRAEYLVNNIKVYGLENIFVKTGNSVDLIRNLEHDLIFIDPPWGDNYKSLHDLKLFLGDIGIEKLVNMIFCGEINLIIPKIIILKLPKNYNMQYLFESINSKNIKTFTLKKMIIVAISN